ncbi:hypothetical protein B7494_g2177 [Chlorociboria aeruginascens]|nr:hypothetical protein B7494_g2177 [Chlorociboria aeruginascens]
MRILNPIATVLGNIGVVLAQTAITVNTASTLQQIDGFGVSQAFGRAAEFQAMADGPRRQGLDYLFNTTTGAGLTIIRNRIGSGGVNDSILPTSPGSPNGTPTYVWDGNDEGQVWFSQSAMTYGVNTIYADAWSAPGFMKTNGNENGGGYLCGVTGHTCSSGDWRQAYANLLAQYVKFYAQVGVNITHIGFLNEPDFTPTYSGMLSDGTMAASFIPTLYNTLQSAGLSTGITCCDAEGWNSQKTMTAQLVSAGMETYLSRITSHSYTSDPNSAMSTSLKIWQTEACDLNDAWCTTWYSNGGACEGLTWAQKIYTGIVSAGLSGYLYWEGVEVNEFQAASYLVASDGTTVTPSGRLWAFAMWSRFIRPGAYRVSTTGTVSGVGLAAFKNTDGSVVALFTNTGSSAPSAKISFSGFTPSSATAYLTDNSHQIAVTTSTLSAGALTVSIPAHSVVTVVLSSSGQSTSSILTSTETVSSSSLVTSSSSLTSLSTVSSVVSSPLSSATAGTIPRYGQCGGTGWTGGTVCYGLLLRLAPRWLKAIVTDTGPPFEPFACGFGDNSKWDRGGSKMEAFVQASSKQRECNITQALR